MSKKLTVSIQEITPAVAENWLTRNFDRNRRMRESFVAQYAADMASGRWHLSDQAISFDTGGRLVNGQHRLEACVRAERPFSSVVIRNLPSESALVIDTGKGRTTDDAFRVAGKDWPRGFGSTVRRIWGGIGYRRGRSYTNQEVDEFMRVYGESVTFAHALLVKGKMAKTAARAVVARAHAADRNSQGRLEEFCHVLTTGIMGRGDESAVLLRNYVLESEHTKGVKGQVEFYALAESALRAFLDRERVKALTPAAEELFPLAGVDDNYRPSVHREYEAV